jgi:hypothetical protein
MLELKAQVVELKTIVSLQRTNEGWQPLADPAKSLPVVVTPPPNVSPSPTEALKQIALLLKAFT